MAERVDTTPESTYQEPADPYFGTTDVEPHDGQPETPAFRPDLSGYGDSYTDTGAYDTEPYGKAGS